MEIHENGKYYSAGEGNLKMTHSGQVENSPHYEKINATYKFDNFVLREADVSIKGDGYINNMGEYVETKRDLKGTYSLKKGAKVSYPNLDKFTKEE